MSRERSVSNNLPASLGSAVQRGNDILPVPQAQLRGIERFAALTTTVAKGRGLWGRVQILPLELILIAESV